MGAKDNESNKADSDSNKVMSMLQLAFLPATAVASIFSVNVINWATNPVAVYDPAFIIFLIFLILVSLVVLVIYFGAKRWQKVKEEREKREAKENEEHENQQMYQPPVPDTTIKPSAKRRHHGKTTSKDRSGMV